MIMKTCDKYFIINRKLIISHTSADPAFTNNIAANKVFNINTSVLSVQMKD